LPRRGRTKGSTYSTSSPSPGTGWRTRKRRRKEILNVRAEFESAAASSLDIVVLADFSGKAAPFYNRLTRAIQRICVEACNKYGWGIAFTQVTVHTADEAPDSIS
jgi:hypothetical protein